MSRATTSGAAAGEPPRPDGVTSLDELIVRLNTLRAWAGVSYRELHRRLVRRRRSRHIAEEPAYATVYRCLQTGRHRLDIDLAVDIVAVLTDDGEAARWREAHAQIISTSVDATAATVLDHLPADLAVFTGREDELDRILDRGRQGGVVAIEGMAGVGKTTLAVHAAHRLVSAGAFGDLQMTANLHGHDPDRGPVDPMAVLDGFLRSLGMSGGRIQTLDLDGRTRAFRDLIARKACLIVLDDAADERQSLPLLPEASSCLVLITSRQRVIQQPDTRHVAVDVFTPQQAVEALQRQVGGQGLKRPGNIAARIVEQVGHLPLAVALVAARMTTTPTWTLDDHVDHLVERRGELRIDAGVELAFATSYEALPPSSRRMLRRLSLHPGRDCDAYAAAVLADVELDTASRLLSDLREANLVSERIAGRFELHDLVRVFAANRVRDEDAPSMRRAALTRLFDYQRHVVAMAVDACAPEERSRRLPVPASDAARPALSGRDEAIAWLTAEWPNTLAITSHGAENGWVEHVCHLSTVLAPYLVNTAKFDDAEVIHGHASRVATAADKGVALKDLATTRWHRGRRHDALRLLHEALAVSRTHGDERNESRVLMNLAIVQRHLGRFNEAIRTHRQALELLRRLDDPVHGRVLGNLGIIYSMLGRWEEALDHQQQALDLSRQLGDAAHEARTLENLVRMYNLLGRHDRARRTAEHALTVARATGERVCESEALVGLGTSLAGLEQLRVAVDLQRQGLAIAQDVGSRTTEVYAHLELGSTLRTQGHVDAAADCYERARSLAAELGDPYEQALAHDGLARVSGDQGDVDGARRHAKEALRLHLALGTAETDNVATYLTELDGLV